MVAVDQSPARMDDIQPEDAQLELAEEEETVTLVDLLQDQARLRKLIDPEGLFTSVSTAR